MTNAEDEQENGQLEPIEIPALPLGKDEMNLAEFPIARLGRRDKRESIEYVGWTVDKSGKRKQQKWTVRSAAGLGLPTEFAERVLVALMARTAEDRFTEPKVSFSVYGILTKLGLTINKRNYKAVEKALRQLVGITIYSEGAFFDKEKQKRVTTMRGFHLIDDVWLKYLEDDDEIIDGEESNAYIVWGERIWNSFKAGYIKNLDVDYYYSLENAMARRLFRFLDKRMHYQDEYQIDIFDLAGRIGLTRYRYPSEVKKKLQPAFDELVERGFLTLVETIKVGRYTRVRFVKRETNAQLPLWDDMGPLEVLLGPSSAQHELSSMQQEYGTTEADLEFWVSLLDSVRYTMNTQVFGIIEGADILKFDDGALTIHARTPLQASMFEHPGYRESIIRTVKYALGMDITLEIVADS